MERQALSYGLGHGLGRALSLYIHLVAIQFTISTISLIARQVLEWRTMGNSGYGEHMESRGELGIVRYLKLFVFVQFLLLSNVCLCSWHRLLICVPNVPNSLTSIMNPAASHSFGTRRPIMARWKCSRHVCARVGPG